MRTRARQRGVAVVTALLLTTLAVTIVASLFWQQQVQVRSMENQRLQLQTRWILRGALDWARLVLHTDGYHNQTATALDHVWNTPLAETRLDQYIERERMEGEAFDATLSGRIIDATSRYNLRSLAHEGLSTPEQVRVFGNLLQVLQMNPELAERAARAVARSQVKVKDDDAGSPMALTTVDDLLAVDGFTPVMVERLRPFVIVLPEVTKVNVNTASPEVLAAVVGGSITTGTTLAAQRKTAYFRTLPEFESRAAGSTPVAGTYDVRSDYFLVESRVKLDRATLNATSLIYRRRIPIRTELLWIRPH